MRIPEIDKSALIILALVAAFLLMGYWVVKGVREDMAHASVEGQMGLIREAIVHYAADFGGSCPPDLGALVLSGHCKDLGLFRIKGSQEPPPGSVEELRAGSCDFLYFGKGRRLEPAPKAKGQGVDESSERVSGLGGSEYQLLATKRPLSSGLHLVLFSDRSSETYEKLPFLPPDGR